MLGPNIDWSEWSWRRELLRLVGRIPKRGALFAVLGVVAVCVSVGVAYLTPVSAKFTIDRSRDYIERFDAELIFSGDLSEMTVIEAIAVMVHGNDRVTKGIYRTLLPHPSIPITAFSVQSASQNGAALPAEFVAAKGTGLPQVKLFDERFKLNPGILQTRLVYTVARPLAWEPDRSAAKLVWNVTSPRTVLPMAGASVRVGLPPGWKVTSGYSGWSINPTFQPIQTEWRLVDDYDGSKPLFVVPGDAPGSGFYWQVGVEIRPTN
jgi:hypothetical protein